MRGFAVKYRSMESIPSFIKSLVVAFNAWNSAAICLIMFGSISVFIVIRCDVVIICARQPVGRIALATGWRALFLYMQYRGSLTPAGRLRKAKQKGTSNRARIMSKREQKTGTQLENDGSVAGHLLATFGTWALMLAQGGE